MSGRDGAQAIEAGRNVWATTAPSTRESGTVQLALPLYNITRRDLDFFFLRSRMSIRAIAARTGYDRKTVTAGIDRVYSEMAAALKGRGYDAPKPDRNRGRITVSSPLDV